MKVRCKKYLSVDGKQELDYGIGITKGKEYIVLGIIVSKNDRHVYIHDDEEDQLPGYINIRQFDIVSEYIPSNWVIRYRENFDILDFYPRSWIEADSF